MEFDHLPSSTQNEIIDMQRNQATAYAIYEHLAEHTRNEEQSRILTELGSLELQSYEMWAKLTGGTREPSGAAVRVVSLLRRVFGITFVTKLVERGERREEAIYAAHPLRSQFPEEIRQGEARNSSQEQTLIGMIDEKRLHYLGSVVLGLNDALVELMGALAGLTFAFQDSRLISLTGLITGIAASFSMGASEYLSQKTDGAEAPLTSAIYTFLSYLLTVAILITPFLLIDNSFVSLVIAGLLALGVVSLFSFYVSLVRDYSFKRRFAEMAVVSLGVAVLSFGVGIVVRVWIGVDV
jgi:VIT1/CCC1 family predicted Fe2+/Mn2+ transporter